LPVNRLVNGRRKVYFLKRNRIKNETLKKIQRV
jgi:hypothetical protein